MTTTTYLPGDRVGVASTKYPGAWTVESLGPVNTLLSPDGGGRKLRVPHHMVTALSESKTEATVVPLPEQTFFDPGELVRVTEGRFAGLYAVIKDSGGDKVNLARLGGDDGRYLRAMRHGIVKVDPSEVLR
jgi:hypothetical protein